uniref:Uncharacterized protein n=1 Tax=Zea mays TaxID=4577 RepID=B6U1W9_MAIZE|nr:hypothetical protein [Zea mays]
MAPPRTRSCRATGFHVSSDEGDPLDLATGVRVLAKLGRSLGGNQLEFVVCPSHAVGSMFCRTSRSAFGLGSESHSVKSTNNTKVDAVPKLHARELRHDDRKGNRLKREKTI